MQKTVNNFPDIVDYVSQFVYAINSKIESPMYYYNWIYITGIREYIEYPSNHYVEANHILISKCW